MMSQSHRIKVGTTDEAFQEQGFLRERGAPVGHFLTPRSFKCSRTFKMLKEREKTKSTIGVLQSRTWALRWKRTDFSQKVLSPWKHFLS